MRSLNSSPVVEGTWQKRREAVVARNSFFSSAAIVLLLGMVYLDINFNTISGYLDVTHWLWQALELAVAAVLSVKVLLNILSLLHYVWTYLFGGPVDLTDRQRSLLGVQLNEHGFRTPPPSHLKTSQATPDSSLIFSGSYSERDVSPHSVFRSLSPGYVASPAPGSGSPAHGHFQTPYSPSMSPYVGNPSHSFDMHQSLNSSAPSPGPYDYADNSFRSRRAFSTPRSASTSPYERIKDQRTLHSFLQEQEDKELRSRQAAQESFNLSAASFWSYGASALDFTHSLRKYAYQLASHLPQYTARASADSATPGVDQVWSKYGVTENDLYVWTEKLRKWLSATIVSRLKKKMVGVNKQLQRVGCEDMQVGEMSVSTLKQLALTKGGMVPALNGLVPYLDFFANQEYLVRRIRDLSTGSMSEFTWNKGGNYGKPWAEHLITDASLMMQLLCTYLDSRLPAQPHYLDGKVFTAQHFIKTPDKPDMHRKDNLLIFQTSINPPHFQIVIGTQTYNLPKGRNNMFQAMLLFFYHIKTKEQGMLGRVNLGLSGLNILWIFD